MLDFMLMLELEAQLVTGEMFLPISQWDSVHRLQAHAEVAMDGFGRV